MSEFEEQAFANGYSAGYGAGRRSTGVEAMSASDFFIKKPTTMKVTVDVGASIPTRAHKTDAGLDLYAMNDGWIFPKSRRAFDTGFHCAIPKGYVGMLASKSGMMLKGITSRGTIDCGYTGSVKAVLFNHSWKFVHIKKGQKITQLVLMPMITPDLDVVDTLEDTERAGGGFGSTGAF